MCVCVRLCELVVFCPSFLRYPAFLFFLSSLLARGLERGCIVGGLNKQNYKKNQKTKTEREVAAVNVQYNTIQVMALSIFVTG